MGMTVIMTELPTDNLMKSPQRMGKEGKVSQAVTKDLSSSSKFSGSCVLTLQTLLEEDGCWLITEITLMMTAVCLLRSPTAQGIFLWHLVLDSDHRVTISFSLSCGTSK